MPPLFCTEINTLLKKTGTFLEIYSEVCTINLLLNTITNITLLHLVVFHCILKNDNLILLHD